MLKAVIYCRVSTKEQAETGYSLENQHRSCTQFAIDQGYQIEKIFIEKGESAKTQNRTEIIKLIEYATHNSKSIDGLIIWKFDRLARNMSDHTELVKIFSKLNILILSVTENNETSASGNFLRNMVGAIAQYENELKSERTTGGMKEAVKKGRWCWQAPFGYKFENDDENKPILRPNKDAEVIQDAFAMAETGLNTISEISEKLSTKYDTKVSNKFLNAALRKPIYAGLIKVSWFPEIVKGIHEKLI